MTQRIIELVAHTPMWKEYFEKESNNLKIFLKNNLIKSYHIGSTAIPSILAKPILDILCVVHTIDGIEKFAYEFEKLGFTSKGEYGIANRLYLIRLAKDGVTHLSHIHIFEKSNPLIADHLDFCAYLNAEEEVAKEYEALKVRLQKKYEQDTSLYTSGKNNFIQTVLKNLKKA